MFPGVAQVVDEDETIPFLFQQVAECVLERVALREAFDGFRILAAGKANEVSVFAVPDFFEMVSFPSHREHQDLLNIAQIHVRRNLLHPLDGEGCAEQFQF